MSTYYITPLDPQELAGRFSTEDALDPIPTADEEWKDLHLDKIRNVLDRLPDREADLIRLYFFKEKRQTDIAEIFNITQAAVSYRLKRATDRIRFLIELPEATKEQVFDDILPYMPSRLDARIFSEMFESTCQSEVGEILNISQGRVRHRFIANLARFGELLLADILRWISQSDNNLEEVRNIQEHVDIFLEINEGDIEPDVFEKELLKVIAAFFDLPDELSSQELRQLLHYYKTFVKIRYNFNILREIKLPKWSKRCKKVIT